MRYWRARGVQRFDWGGRGDYKEKYGPVRARYARLYRSRFAWLRALREPLRRLVHDGRRLAGWLRARPRAVIDLGRRALPRPSYRASSDTSSSR
jgi:hypothetical protein